MKNYLYSLTAIAVLFLAVACSESGMSSDVERVTKVTFTINLNDGADSRTIGDGTTAKTLLYELRRGNEVVEKRTVANAFANGLTCQVTLEVVAGREYDYVFWAQSPEAPYGTDDLSAIRMNYEDSPANDEHRDAFYATGSFVGGESYGHVVLRRPFAQLNVGGQDCMYENVSLGDMYIEYSTVHLKKIPSVFHPFTGEATEPKDIEFEVALTPDKQTGDTLWVEIDSMMIGYRYLAQNYVLAHTDKTLFDSWLGLYGSPTIEILGTPVTNIPLQRNYRTNLLFSCGGGEGGGGGGSIEMADVSFIIVIDPNFKDDYVGPPFN